MGLSSASGCLDRPIGLTEPKTTNVFIDTISQDSVERIDLLFMIDNSTSMSDKQEILSRAVPDLVNRLVNPICLDVSGNQYPPPAPGEDCELGRFREFRPVDDINVAIVSSSLGDAGAESACTSEESLDLAHAMGSLSRGAGMANSGEGFLEWRPGGSVEDLVGRFQDMVIAVSDRGCGYEASLESWYRFLIDPQPYASLVRVQCPGGSADDSCVVPETDAEGNVVLDEELLRQREAFLRPDSLVAIIMLSDENDCSIQARGQYWVVAEQGSSPMYRGSSACDSDPNDPCCYSCPLGAPEGCAADPVCEATATSIENRLSNAEDGQNLRCFDQKRRFGFDFLYPTDRYVNALNEPLLCVNRPNLDSEGCDPAFLHPNPLYGRSDKRDPGWVYLGGIVGVPWQAIAAEARSNQQPLGADELRFKTYSELNDDDWLDILGQPGGSPPRNPLMRESVAPRPGVEMGNPINGRDYDTSQGTTVPDDLQYSCIFPLSVARRCDELDGEDGDSCDCYDGAFDKPLCERFPGDGSTGTVQYHAKAYPGLRQLQVLRDFGAKSGNSIVASICARNVLDDSRPDFGYRPAMTAIVDRLKEQLANRCLPRRLEPMADGRVPCSLIEVRFDQPSCECDESIARTVPDADIDLAIRARLVASHANRCAPDDPRCEAACLCNVEQVSSIADRMACQNAEDAVGVEGWCYVAATADQVVGNADLVSKCPATQRRLLRFVGEGLAPNSLTFVACSGASFQP